MKHLLRSLSLLLVVALAACGQTPPPEDTGPETASGTLNAPTAAPTFLGAAILLADAAMVVAPAAVIEVQEGIFTGTMSPVNADGTVDIILPEADEMPASVLSPAGEFFYGFDYTTCELSTSAPEALVSEVLLGLAPMPLPGMVFFSVEGNAFAVTTPQPVDMDAADPSVTGFVWWLYADSAVTVGTPAAGCDFNSIAMHIDLALEEGWNQVELLAEIDPVTDIATSATISNSAYEELYFNLAPSF